MNIAEPFAKMAIYIALGLYSLVKSILHSKAKLLATFQTVIFRYIGAFPSYCVYFTTFQFVIYFVYLGYLVLSSPTWVTVVLRGDLKIRRHYDLFPSHCILLHHLSITCSIRKGIAAVNFPIELKTQCR